MLMQFYGEATAAWGDAFYSVISLGLAWVQLLERIR